MALSLINLAPTLALFLEPRGRYLKACLGGDAALISSSFYVPVVSPARRRKMICSGAGTGVGTGTLSTGSGLIPSPQNGTTLATILFYPITIGVAISLPSAAASSIGNSPIEPTTWSGREQSTVTVKRERTVTVMAKVGV